MPANNDIYNRAGDIWWSEDESLSMLRTMLNPVRVPYFLDVLGSHPGVHTRGLSALDVGCGGGLLAEEFARLGMRVTGVDLSRASLRTARDHASGRGLSIRYVAAAGERLPFAGESFDVAVCCDVLEHVADARQVIAEIARVLKPGSLFLYDTINRTLRSRIMVIGAFQKWKWTSCAPPDLHDWKQFIRPRELRAMMAEHGLESGGETGIGPQANPIELVRQMRRRKRGEISPGELGRRMKMAISRSLAVSYIGWARKTGVSRGMEGEHLREQTRTDGERTDDRAAQGSAAL